MQVDVRLDEIVLHTLEKEPERRYQHASEVKTDVENVAGTPPPPEGVATDNLVCLEAPTGGTFTDSDRQPRNARSCRIPGTNLALVESRNGQKLVNWNSVAVAWVLFMLVGALGLGLIAIVANQIRLDIKPETFQTAGVILAFVAAAVLTIAVRPSLRLPDDESQLPCRHDPLPATRERGAKSVGWSDGLGSLWALAGLVLLVGKKVARTEPLMYSFFDVGGWFYPSSYLLLVAVCFGFALACLVIPRLSRRTRGRERTGHKQTVSTATSARTSPASVPRPGVTWATVAGVAAAVMALLVFLLAIVPPTLQRDPSAASAFGPELEVSLSSLGTDAGDRFLDLDEGRIVRPPSPYSGWSRERKHEWLRQNGMDLMLMGSAFQSWSLLTPVDNATKLTKVPAHAWQQGLDPEDGGRPPESAEAIQFVTQGVELLQVRLDGRPTHPDHTFAFQTANGARGILKVSGNSFSAGDGIVGLKLRFKKFQAATTVRASPREVVAEWLRRVKAGTREAWNLTTRSSHVGWGPSFTGLWEYDRIRPLHQLGSAEQAMVLSNPFNDNSGRRRVFFAALRKRDGQWLVDRHECVSPSDARSLMKGFAVNPGMKFDVIAAELVGEWGASCDSTISLAADGTGAQLRVGPGGPDPGAKPESFQWEVSGSALRRQFADRDEKLEILWMDDHDVQFRSPNESEWDAWFRTPQGDRPAPELPTTNQWKNRQSLTGNQP